MDRDGFLPSPFKLPTSKAIFGAFVDGSSCGPGFPALGSRPVY